MRLDEIKEQYPNEWVLIEFTELDDELRVVEGTVVAHSPSRNQIENELMALRNGKIAVEYTGEGDPNEAYLLHAFPARVRDQAELQTSYCGDLSASA